MENFEMDKFLDYIRPEDNELLRDMKAYAITNNIPIIRNEMKQFLETLVMIYKPKRILEIGTAIGYSSIVMVEALRKSYKTLEGIELISLERSDEMYSKAIENINLAKLSHIIKIRHDEAEIQLKKIVNSAEKFDIIFMDAAKGQYLTFLPYCMKLLPVNGLLISDNVLQSGEVAKSRFSVPRRQRTIHQRMREYLWELNHREDLQTSIIDIADGVTLSVKLS